MTNETNYEAVKNSSILEEEETTPQVGGNVCFACEG